MKAYIIRSFLLLFSFVSFSQTTYKGMIMSKENPQGNLGVPDVTVHWLNTNISAITNQKGWFEIAYKKEYKKLVVSYLGYKTDTLTITSLQPIHHFLTPNTNLDEVVVETKQQSIQKSFLSARNTFTVNKAELLKAACCNLAESFETNPSIDINFTDALTGTKQIAMLGLTSPYLLITQENIPSIRGASQVFGLTFIPGTWVESIQVTKGSGSVVNGFESISGQINAELVKPFSDHQIFVNSYASVNGRLEGNVHLNRFLSEKWQTGLYIHGNHRGEKFDRNNDGFMDVPLANQINIMNRWQFTDAENGWVSFINFHYVNDDKQTGEINFNPDRDRIRERNAVLSGDEVWGSEIETEKFDASVKLGYVSPELPYRKVSFQAAFSNHNQQSYFGLKNYNITHRSTFANLMYSSLIGDTRSTFKTGLSFTQDFYDELVNTAEYKRTENAIGGFFEYAFDNLDDFSLTAGLRVDAHNLLGVFMTPRLHLRYVPWRKGVVKASVGRGKRSANIFAENQQLFASNRAISIDDAGGNIYGLSPEIAWNYGFSVMQQFNLWEKNGDITLDFYQTNFVNQVVVDWENPQQIQFYNLEGKSIANSLQLEVNYNIVKGFDVRMAYKYFDVSTDYKSGNLQKPLQTQHRFFANFSYNTPQKENNNQWKFDITFNAIGKQRLPSTSSNQVVYQLPEFSNPFQLINTQVTKVFSKQFEIYLGSENLTNVQQENPILGSDNPFGNNFDTSIIYAPIFGRTIYTGLRYKLN